MVRWASVRGKSFPCLAHLGPFPAQGLGTRHIHGKRNDLCAPAAKSWCWSRPPSRAQRRLLHVSALTFSAPRRHDGRISHAQTNADGVVDEVAAGMGAKVERDLAPFHWRCPAPASPVRPGSRLRPQQLANRRGKVSASDRDGLRPQEAGQGIGSLERDQGDES